MLITDRMNNTQSVHLIIRGGFFNIAISCKRDLHVTIEIRGQLSSSFATSSGNSGKKEWCKAERNKWNLSQQNVYNIPPSWTINDLQMFKECKLQRIDSINDCCGGKQIKIMLQVFSTASRQQWFASMSCSFVLHWSNYCHPVVPGCKLAFGDLKNRVTQCLSSLQTLASVRVIE